MPKLIKHLYAAVMPANKLHQVTFEKTSVNLWIRRHVEPVWLCCLAFEGKNMFKNTLIAAALMAASLASFAQTAVAPAAATATPSVTQTAVQGAKQAATQAATQAVQGAMPAALKPAVAAPAPAAAPAPTPAAPAAVAPAPAKAPAAAALPAVKKSGSNICHDETSAGYKSTKNFKPFASMDECIKSGGRAPKAAKAKK
jgi:hypothetical protein